jgi:hypothetical protein
MFLLFISLTLLVKTHSTASKTKESGLSDDLIKWANTNGVQFHNVELRSDNKFYITRDVYQGDIILSIPLSLTIHSLEDFIYKEYFNITEKQTLIGRLLIEKTLGEESSFYPWVTNMHGANEMEDFYHLSEAELKQLNRRSFEEFSLSERRQAFVKLRRNIPSEIFNEKTFNYDVYNWANSIIDGHGFIYMIDEFSGNKLSQVRIYNPSKYQPQNLILIPLLDLVKIIVPEHRQQSSWFGPSDSVYSHNFIQQNRDRLDIKAQRNFNKGEELVFLDVRSNRDFLLYNG